MLRESDYWNAVGTTWDRDLPDPLWRRHSDAVNTALLERWLPRGPIGSLLKTDAFDEAVGKGLFALLASRAARVVEMDLSTTTLASARSRNPAMSGVVADARRLPFAGDSFDAIVSNSTLDHFHTRAELETSLGELYRVLQPNGQLILTLDNPRNPAVAVRNLMPFGLLFRMGLLPYYVGATMGPRRLREALRRIGFEVIEQTAILHCPRILAVRRARWLSRHAPPEKQNRFLARALRFESLSRWPTKFISGHFIAVRVTKPAGPPLRTA